MKKKANNVLDQVLEQVNPDEKTVKEINSSLKVFLLKFNFNIRFW